jgi:hypothetical protein
MKLSLALIICFELLIAPIMPSLRLITSEATIAQSNYCPEGQYFDSTRGRCLITQDAAQNLNAMTRCEQISDINEREKCFKDNAESSLDENGVGASGSDRSGIWGADDNGATDVWGGGIMNAAAIAMPMMAVTHGLKNLTGGTCAAVSYIALAAAGASLFISDLAANLKHASNLGKIEEDWKALLGKGEEEEGVDLDDKRQDSLEAQKEAFEMLARAEDSYAEMATIKAWGHGIAAAAFLTAVVAAIVELADPKGVCAPEPEAPTTDPVPASDSVLNNEIKDQNGNTIVDSNGNVQLRVPEAPRLKLNFFGSSPLHEQTLKRDTIFDILNTSYKPEFDPEIKKLINLKNIQSAKNFSELATIMSDKHPKYSSPSLDEYKKNQDIFREMDKIEISHGIDVLHYVKIIALNLNPISTASAVDYSSDRYESSGDKYKEIIIKSLASGLGGGAVSLLGFIPSVGSAMTHPGTRIGFGILLGAWSVSLIFMYADWAEKAKNKAAKIREIKDNFDAGGNTLNPCESSDRNNPAKPECYCFTPEGPKNTSRMSSQVCMAYFGSNPNLISDQYGAISSGVNNCIDKNRQPDPKCNCKKSSKGCLVLNPSNANIDLGTFKALGSGFKPLNQSMNGSFNPAKTSLADLQNNAMRMRNLSKKILKSPKYAKIGKNLDAMTKKMEQKILKETSSLKPISQPSSRPIPTDPKAAVAALEKDLKEAKEQFKELQVAPGVNPGGSGGGEKEPGLDFGLSAEDLEAQKGDLAKAMNQKLDYGQNDISASDGNIFQVLSNRYMRSGMRRLFDEEGKLEAEKPAESDINK